MFSIENTEYEKSQLRARFRHAQLRNEQIIKVVNMYSEE